MKSREKIRIECACGGGMAIDASPAWLARRVEEIFLACHNSPQCSHPTMRPLDPPVKDSLDRMLEPGGGFVRYKEV